MSLKSFSHFIYKYSSTRTFVCQTVILPMPTQFIMIYTVSFIKVLLCYLSLWPWWHHFPYLYFFVYLFWLFQIENKKLDWKAQPKIGSMDNAKHTPGGGDKKVSCTHETACFVLHLILILDEAVVCSTLWQSYIYILVIGRCSTQCRSFMSWTVPALYVITWVMDC